MKTITKITAIEITEEERQALLTVRHMLNEIGFIVSGNTTERHPLGTYLVSDATGEVLFDMDVEALKGFCDSFLVDGSWTVTE